MKKLWFILVPLLAAIGWLAWRAEDAGQQPAADSAPISWKGAPPTFTLNDAGEIFKKAFWRRPAADDEILHAVRHEWSDEEGLLHWQWFLVVKASPGLITYLREDNAFGLLPASSAPPGSEVPAWFRYDPGEVALLQSPQSSMQLFFSNHDKTLYATASGRGFTRGAPEPPPAAQGAPRPGRLPTTPPPRPQ
jgi:hypothetical protein